MVNLKKKDNLHTKIKPVVLPIVKAVIELYLVSLWALKSVAQPFIKIATYAFVEYQKYKAKRFIEKNKANYDLEGLETNE